MDHPDLTDLGDSIRGVLSEICTPVDVRVHAESNAARLEPLWTKATELGWLGLIVPEEHGGLGLGVDAAMVTHAELGRALAPAPFLGTFASAACLAVYAPAVLKDEWLTRIAAGQVAGGVSAAAAFDWSALRITGQGDSRALTGAVHDVLDGAAVDFVLAPATEPDGARRFVLLSCGDPGVELEKVSTVDRTRHLATWRVDGVSVPVSRVLNGDGDEIADALSAFACMALVFESLGGAEETLRFTVEYLKTREQFGKLIGSFQGLKHRCADHKVALEAARALADGALEKWATKAPDARLDAALAKATVCDMFSAIATDAVQLHGGIGFTWEHPCHLYLKRAKLNQVLFGESAVQLDRAAAALR